MTVLSRLSCAFIVWIILFFACTLAAEDQVLSGWAHLELGAGNYGSDGHTKASQAMTVLMKIKKISDKKTYIDDLEDAGPGDYNPEEQYGVLFWTLDELIRRYGDVGVFHVNDLYEEYAIYAVQKLKAYAANKDYNSIIIEAVAGDYQLIDAEKTLSPHGKTKYSTVHLKNPEVSFYHDRMDGEDFYSSDQSRLQTRLMLQYLADLSETGLFLFILDHEDFIPLEERMEFMEKNIFYEGTGSWDPVPYIFPEGYIEKAGKVFHIKQDYRR
jgi:hypothetical protein